MRRPRAVRNAWFAARYLLGSHEVTYPLLRFAPAPYVRVMVDGTRDACIEGLPRSATTFGVLAFLEQNPGVNLAHHMHVPLQFVRAVRLGVPCAVLVREPLANLTSLVIAGENDLSHELAFRIYIDYHRRLAEVCGRLALCRFDEVLEDPSVVTRRLNERYGTGFRAEPMGAAQKRAVVARIEGLERESAARPGLGTVPNAYKESLKPAVAAALERHRLLPRARAAYAEVARHVSET